MSWLELLFCSQVCKPHISMVWCPKKGLPSTLLPRSCRKMLIVIDLGTDIVVDGGQILFWWWSLVDVRSSAHYRCPKSGRCEGNAFPPDCTRPCGIIRVCLLHIPGQRQDTDCSPSQYRMIVKSQLGILTIGATSSMHRRGSFCSLFQGSWGRSGSCNLQYFTTHCCHFCHWCFVTTLPSSIRSSHPNPFAHSQRCGVLSATEIFRNVLASSLSSSSSWLSWLSSVDSSSSSWSSSFCSPTIVLLALVTEPSSSSSSLSS